MTVENQLNPKLLNSKYLLNNVTFQCRRKLSYILWGHARCNERQRPGNMENLPRLSGDLPPEAGQVALRERKQNL